MDKIEAKYHQLISLLREHSQGDSLINECISQLDEELSFHTFANIEERKVPKEQIVEIYQDRASMEEKIRPNNPFVIGYEKLIPKLEKSRLLHINVSSINTVTGSYIIFSDYAFTEFIGILKSKRTLPEIRELMSGDKYHTGNLFKGGVLKK